MTHPMTADLQEALEALKPFCKAAFQPVEWMTDEQIMYGVHFKAKHLRRAAKAYAALTRSPAEGEGVMVPRSYLEHTLAALKDANLKAPLSYYVSDDDDLQLAIAQTKAHLALTPAPQDENGTR